MPAQSAPTHCTPALAAAARERHALALDALADGGRRVPADVASAMGCASEEVPTMCAFGVPGPCALYPQDDPLPTTYRVAFDRWFGNPCDKGTRMVELRYEESSNVWLVVRNFFFAMPETPSYQSKNGSAQGCHLDRRGYRNPTFPVPPGHLRHTSAA